MNLFSLLIALTLGYTNTIVYGDGVKYFTMTGQASAPYQPPNSSSIVHYYDWYNAQFGNMMNVAVKCEATSGTVYTYPKCPELCLSYMTVNYHTNWCQFYDGTNLSVIYPDAPTPTPIPPTPTPTATLPPTSTPLPPGVVPTPLWHYATTTNSGAVMLLDRAVSYGDVAVVGVIGVIILVGLAYAIVRTAWH